MTELEKMDAGLEYCLFDSEVAARKENAPRLCRQLVAAGVVVTKSISDNCVGAGIPARIIKELDDDTVPQTLARETAQTAVETEQDGLESPQNQHIITS